MYIFQLMGGLGNQMFQYAAAKALANATGKQFKLDFDCPYQHVKYQYNLDVFTLKGEMATAADLRAAKPKKRWMRRLYMLVGKNPNGRLVQEKKDFQFDQAFFAAPDGSYMRGFWQTELYFKNIEDEIRKDFSFRIRPAGRNIELTDEVLSCTAVSLHIRRGDYVKVAATNHFHGVCSPEYYKAAIEYIEMNVSNPVFFIFSDDMDWVKSNFNIQSKHAYVDCNNAATNYEDLRLMSLCRHHIIANSSFSWWGAWLNPRKDKIVIAPKRWMKDEQFNTHDLIPASWLRM